MHVCVEDRVDIVPGGVDAFYTALGDARPRLDTIGVRLAGAFHTAGATGRWNEMFVYWEFDDMAHFGRVMAGHDGPGSLCDLADPNWTLRAGGSSVTMYPTEYCPTLAEVRASGITGTVFLHEYIHPLPGRREAFVQHYVDNYLEATRKAGRELVGIWNLQRSANDVLILLALADWAAQAHAVGTKPDAYAERPWRVSAPQLRSDYDLRMLVAGPAAVNPLRPQ
jgi:hypothetical protein